ncbi:hypothetical protein Tco_1318191, partial [Tanacetum coccineum]
REISEDLRLAREINSLCARVTAIIDERENFVDELDILVGREFKLRAREKGIRLLNLDVFCVVIVYQTCGDVVSLTLLSYGLLLPDMPFSLLIDSLVAIRMNRLVDEMNEACQDRIAFVQELESVEGVTVMAKTAVFLKEMMDKEGSKEWQLHDLENDAKEKGS